MTLLFSATYPDRTAAAVLYGSSLGVWTPQTPWLRTREQVLANVPEVERRWGTVEFTRDFIAARAPSLPEDDDDLVAGSGITFEDRGVHVLKGLPEERRLYAVAGV